MNLPLLPQDKANHIFYGALVFLVGAVVGAQFGVPPSYCGLALSTLVGALKEAADGITNYRVTGDPRVGPHGFEFLDVAATVLGGALCFAASRLT